MGAFVVNWVQMNIRGCLLYTSLVLLQGERGVSGSDDVGVPGSDRRGLLHLSLIHIYGTGQTCGLAGLDRHDDDEADGQNDLNDR